MGGNSYTETRCLSFMLRATNILWLITPYLFYRGVCHMCNILRGHSRPYSNRPKAPLPTRQTAKGIWTLKVQLVPG